MIEKMSVTEQSMKTIRYAASGLIPLGLILVGGCRKAPPPPPPPPPVQWQPPPSRPGQVHDLVEQADNLDQAIAKLPGESMDAHRQAFHDGLVSLAKALRLAEGSGASPQFASRVGVVESSRDQLAGANISRPQLEAAENEAVRASLAILDQISADQLSDDDQLKKLLETAQGTLDPMYTTGGPMHDLVATDGLKAVAAAVRRVSDDLVERVGKMEPPPPPPPPPPPTPAAETTTAPSAAQPETGAAPQTTPPPPPAPTPAPETTTPPPPAPETPPPPAATQPN
jgi:hypothetical protein